MIATTAAPPSLPRKSPWIAGTTRLAIPLTMTRSSTVWFTTPTASSFAASRAIDVMLRSRRQSIASSSAVFLSDSGRPLTRFGLYKLVRRHTVRVPTGENQRHVSPHVFRHTTAVHLLESGVDVNVIRSWLGHVSLDTTNRYAEINIRMKQEALEACQPPSTSSVGPP